MSDFFLNPTLNISFSFSGHSLLRSSMAVEELGVGQDLGLEDGSGPGHFDGGRAEAEEEAPARLPALQSQEPQLLGLQILLLRVSRPTQSFW